MEPAPRPQARRINATQTHDLRHAVLRPNAPRKEAQFDGDLEPHSAHFGSYRGDQLIAIASVYREPRVGSTNDGEWRLRGMAAAPSAQRTGGGAAALAAVEAHVREHGGTLLWCNARTPAVPFYERAGWVVVGDEFDIPGVGPHFVMEKPLD
ncbi:MAG: acetyltransferase, family [Thermoleophilia bacterium]|nr:acetyltransferase, family [Thermoleophilia bacterium]